MKTYDFSKGKRGAVLPLPHNPAPACVCTLILQVVLSNTPPVVGTELVIWNPEMLVVLVVIPYTVALAPAVLKVIEWPFKLNVMLEAPIVIHVPAADMSFCRT